MLERQGKMINQIISGDIALITFLVQVTVCLSLGLAGAMFLRKRPARAHQLLFLCILVMFLEG